VKNRGFITAIAKQAAIFAMIVSISVSAQAESIHTAEKVSFLPDKDTYPIADTALAPSQFILSDVDTSTLQGTSTQPVVDTGLTQSKLRREINYTGVALSAFIPGSGQICQSRYVMGGMFFAAEASAVGFAVYWSGSTDKRYSKAQQLRDISDINALGLSVNNDSAMRAALLERAGRYSVLADEADFDARASRHTVYNALAWVAGLHLYNILDALESGGLTTRGLERSPTAAGLLAAVPFLGLGQLYNERPSKAGMMAMAQAGLAFTAYNQHRLMTIASDKYNQMRDSASAQYAYRADHLSNWKSRYDKAFSSRNTYLWLSLAVYIYSIFDAVVDAHLSDFNAKIDLGTDLSMTPGGGVAVNVTMGLKRSP